MRVCLNNCEHDTEQFLLNATEWAQNPTDYSNSNNAPKTYNTRTAASHTNPHLQCLDHSTERVRVERKAENVKEMQ